MSVILSVNVSNKHYDDNRLTIVGSHSSNRHFSYSESVGTRYFVNQLSSTASSNMDAVTFDAMLTFTSSDTNIWDYSLIPMGPGESCSLNGFEVYGQKSDGTKGFQMFVINGAYRHSGSALTQVGGAIQYSYVSDFTGATAYFTASATASINLVVQGTSEIIDWDLFIRYKKGYHTLTSAGGGGGGVWYPDPPPPTG